GRSAAEPDELRSPTGSWDAPKERATRGKGELLNQALAQRQGDGVGAVGGPHLREDVRDVRLHRLGADAEFLRNLLVGLAEGQELKDVVLTLGQRLGSPALGLGHTGEAVEEVAGDGGMQRRLAFG